LKFALKFALKRQALYMRARSKYPTGGGRKGNDRLKWTGKNTGKFRFLKMNI
jgi:hypothetical protein